MDRNILRACREDPRHTSTDMQVSVTFPNEPGPSRRTIRRRLQVAGLHGRRPVKKPLGPREWANHIWSDESKFNLFGLMVFNGFDVLLAPDMLLSTNVRR
uniref:HTH_Tnp_Tc3_2 domain-containing protein n=1 Tax=Caenorhabditis japonica TaxID=281687 RepID=A0A8R1ICR4_CAEJA